MNARNCGSNPCMNGATCDNPHGRGVRCTCSQGWTGKLCDVAIVCESNPCQHEGTCTANDQNSYQCLCTAGWSGESCQYSSSDEEVSDSFHDYSSGYFHSCESYNPCENGATCQEAEDMKCVCAPGFTGQICAQDNCSSNPCANDGSCTDVLLPMAFRCTCAAGWQGTYCEEKTISHFEQCENGGTCTPNDDEEGFHCDCANGYYGHRCQHTNTTTVASASVETPLFHSESTNQTTIGTSKVSTQRKDFTERPTMVTRESDHRRTSTVDNDGLQSNASSERDKFIETSTLMSTTEGFRSSLATATSLNTVATTTSHLLRPETEQTFDAPSSPDPDNQFSTGGPGYSGANKSSIKTGAIIGAVIAVLVVFALLVIAYSLIRKRRLKSSAMNSGVTLQNLAYDTTLPSVETPAQMPPSYNNDGRASGGAFYYTLEPDTGESSYTELEKVPKSEYQPLTTTTSKTIPNQPGDRELSEGALQQQSVSGFVENIAYESGEPRQNKNMIQAEDHGFKENIAYESFDQAENNSSPRDGISGEGNAKDEGFVENIAYEGGEPLRSNGGNDIENDRITENADYETVD
ncbi:uncharacterized protein [Ptychodera flava]